MMFHALLVRHSRLSTTAEQAWLEDASNHHLTAADDLPDLLVNLPDTPSELWVRGDADALFLPCLAMVGSRNPTRGGRDNAYRFARHLAGIGFCIVSGLAEGIDTAAHEGAIDAGGKTVAVLGHGIDRIYPAANRRLAERIAKHGALVTEYPLGTPPRRFHFPERNRIISGLALGTLVIEAAQRSGSLITARLAGDQGREVFAIPGSIHNPMAHGCHQLIRQGARLVENADDIVSELAPLVAGLAETPAAPQSTEAPTELDQDYVRLLECMGFDPTSADELAQKSALTIEQVSSMLLILELNGEVESLPGGKFSRLSN